jgi:hypothetical protein
MVFCRRLRPCRLRCRRCPDTTARRWDSTALLIIELVAFAMTLGPLADRAVLLKHGLPRQPCLLD